jgi:hypothetical protein
MPKVKKAKRRKKTTDKLLTTLKNLCSKTPTMQNINRNKNKKLKIVELESF